MEQRCPESNHTCSLLQAGKGAGPGPALGRVSDQAPRMIGQGEEDDEEEAWLQLRPVEPLPSQCCGSGCSPCVFDVNNTGQNIKKMASTSIAFTKLELQSLLQHGLSSEP